MYKLVKQKPLTKKTLTWLKENGKDYSIQTHKAFGIEEAELLIYEKKTFVSSERVLVIPIGGDANKIYCYQRPEKKDRWLTLPKGTKARLLFSPEFETEKRIIVVEGEWDFLKLYDLGYKGLVTGTAGGAKWKKEWAGPFSRKSVVIVPDCDDAGRNYAREVVNALVGIATEIRIIDLKLAIEGGDVSDYFQYHTRDDFETLIRQAVPVTQKIKDEKPTEIETSFMELNQGFLEQIFDGNMNQHGFCYINGEDKSWGFREEILTGDKKYIPSGKELLEAPLGMRAVYLSSKPEEYGTEEELINEIETYLKKYIKDDPIWIKFYTYYVLFTWIADRFTNVLYLRFLASYDCGKSRHVEVIGLICYKPIFSTGVNSEAALYRVLSQFNGTLCHDEADLRQSDADIGLIKVLNQGYSKLWPIIKCDGDGYRPKPYRAFGAKIIATRKRFKDEALESRCLTKILVEEDIPENIPLSLDLSKILNESLQLRNKLLMWRIQNYHRCKIDPSTRIFGVANRLNQVSMPLLSIIQDKAVRESMRQNIVDYHKATVEGKKLSTEAAVLSAILEKWEETFEADGTDILVKDIAEIVNKELGTKYISRQIAKIIREGLFLKVERGMNGVKIMVTKPELAKLKRKYFFESEEEETETDVDF